MLVIVIQDHLDRASGENLLLACLLMAPFSQELAPPEILGSFTTRAGFHRLHTFLPFAAQPAATLQQ
jgi:hypothetical protein